VMIMFVNRGKSLCMITCGLMVVLLFYYPRCNRDLQSLRLLFTIAAVNAVASGLSVQPLTSQDCNIRQRLWWVIDTHILIRVRALTVLTGNIFCRQDPTKTQPLHKFALTTSTLVAIQQ
jgi:uncharacterized protein involved in response to NO